MYFTASKGRIAYNYFISNLGYSNTSTVSGGTVIIKDGVYINSGTTNPYFINVTSGSLIATGRWYRKDTYTGSGFANIDGGTFISNGGVMIRNNSHQQFITAYGSSQNVNIYTLACNGNVGEFLSAKAQKNKINITSLTQPTAFTLNSTGITSTVNSSKADIAADLVSKVNAAALGVTATQDNPGIDEYFYITANVAGTPFTVLSFTNCTNIYLDANSKSITDLTGGQLIENSNVTY